MIKIALWSIAAAWIGLAGPPRIVSAQQPTTVSGRVTADGTPLQGALVAIPALGLGGYTDAEGQYSINAPATATGRTVMLTARRIGYAPDSVQITLSGGTVERDISLSLSATQLTGIVVTALGVERERAQLGTAQQQITSTDLTTTKAMNLVQQVQGKISGVTITGGILNVFNAQPPVISWDAGQRLQNYALAATQYDLRGRTFFVRLGYEF